MPTARHDQSATSFDRLAAAPGWVSPFFFCPLTDGFPACSQSFPESSACMSVPRAEERAVIVQLDFGRDDLAEQLEEVRLLTRSAGAAVCAVVHGRRHSPDAATYAGKGKVEEVAAEVPRTKPTW
jgi:hypothetical protein